MSPVASSQPHIGGNIMRKPWKALLIVLLVAVIGCLAIVGFHIIRNLAAGPAVPLGYFDGIDCNLRPRQVGKLLGEPVKVEDQMDLSETMTYRYELKLDETEAVLRLSFVDDKWISMAFLDADAGTRENAERLFALWKDRIAEAYASEEGYYCRELQTSADGSWKLELGFQDGAVGTSAELTLDGSKITIRTDFCY